MKYFFTGFKEAFEIAGALILACLIAAFYFVIFAAMIAIPFVGIGAGVGVAYKIFQAVTQ